MPYTDYSLLQPRTFDAVSIKGIMKSESLKPMLVFNNLIMKILINGNIPGVRAYMLYIRLP